MKKIKRIIKKTIHNLGYDIVPFTTESSKEALLLELIKKKGINLILDVGANIGHYGLYLRKIGYSENIVSFEPMEKAFAQLSEFCKKDNMWSCENCGLGAVESETIIHISKNSESSSLLEMNESHLKGAPDSIYIGDEKVKINTLNFYKDSLLSKSENIFLKVDTQGFELEVLKGAFDIMPFIKIIQLELSFKELYKGAPVFTEMVQYMNNNGYVLVSLEKVFSDVNTFELLQVDGLFVKHE